MQSYRSFKIIFKSLLRYCVECRSVILSASRIDRLDAIAGCVVVYYHKFKINEKLSKNNYAGVSINTNKIYSVYKDSFSKYRNVRKAQNY